MLDADLKKRIFAIVIIDIFGAFVLYSVIQDLVLTIIIAVLGVGQSIILIKYYLFREKMYIALKEGRSLVSVSSIAFIIISSGILFIFLYWYFGDYETLKHIWLLVLGVALLLRGIYIANNLEKYVQKPETYKKWARWYRWF